MIKSKTGPSGLNSVLYQQIKLGYRSRNRSGWIPCGLARLEDDEHKNHPGRFLDLVRLVLAGSSPKLHFLCLNSKSNVSNIFS
jgi:hypothetical protein